jgi:hypothetical protein
MLLDIKNLLAITQKKKKKTKKKKKKKKPHDRYYWRVRPMNLFGIVTYILIYYCIIVIVTICIYIKMYFYKVSADM